MKKYGTPTPPSSRICGVCGMGRNTLTCARKMISAATALSPVSEGRRRGAADAPAPASAAEAPPTPLRDAVLIGALIRFGVYGENVGFAFGVYPPFRMKGRQNRSRAGR